MKRFLLLPGVLLLVFFAACAPPPELRNAKLLRDTSLLSGEPCQAPCWRGITPGETAWNEALIILEDDAELTNVQTQDVQDSEAKQASWQQVDGEPCCQMLTQDGQTVSVLFLQVAPDMTLSGVIEQYGEPTYVVGNAFTDDQAIMNLIYPEVPMVLYAFVPGAETGSVSETSEIIGVLYLTASDMDLLTKTTNLHAWDGYGAYKAYDEGEFEVTPSVTLTPTPASE